MKSLNDIILKSLTYGKKRHVLFGEADDPHSLSTEDVKREIVAIHTFLASKGLRENDTIAIISHTSPRWTFADFAILTLGGVTVPIYPTLHPAQTAEILKKVECRTVFVGDEQLLGKVIALKDEVPSIEMIILMKGSREGEGIFTWDDPRFRKGGRLPVRVRTQTGSEAQKSPPDMAKHSDDRRRRSHPYGEEEGASRAIDGGNFQAAVDHTYEIWDDIIGDEKVDPEAERLFRERARARTGDDPATIIFTSGTTGEPKGVVLTHNNILANVLDTHKVLSLSDEDVALVFLPLSHILERMVDFLFWMQGLTIAYSASIKGVGEDLTRYRPMIFTSVPRLYEKIDEKIRLKAESGSVFKRALFQRARSIAMTASEMITANTPFPFGFKLRYALYDTLVFKRIRHAFGGRLRFCISGGAALNPSVARFLIGSGIFILEGYGLTETSPVLSVNTPQQWKIGTVGPPIDSVEIRIADDGEILAKGPNVFTEYYKNPEATREAFTEDGFFKTGDLGRLDENGFLSITGRKKDLIVTAGGKNIAPIPIEDSLKRHILVSQAVVIGDARPYLIVLIVPDFDSLFNWAHGEGLVWTTKRELLREKRVLSTFQKILDEVNTDFARYEQPKRFLLIAEEFTEKNGLMTPTLKVRRESVAERYREDIEALYSLI